jgi:hypothetical protein
MGYIRTHLWTVLHFPLHLAALLTVEGAATLIVWNISKNFATELSKFFLDMDWNTSNGELCISLNNTIRYFTRESQGCQPIRPVRLAE